jgi:hypothetical protein
VTAYLLALSCIWSSRWSCSVELTVTRVTMEDSWRLVRTDSRSVETWYTITTTRRPIRRPKPATSLVETFMVTRPGTP